jgi:hypothetical protein
MLDRLGDRRVVIIDVRGRGSRDAPPTGYAWEDHIGDLRAVVASLEVERQILVAFSRGSSHAQLIVTQPVPPPPLTPARGGSDRDGSSQYDPAPFGRGVSDG